MDPQILLRNGLGALDHHLRGRRRPLNVMIALTNRCNAHCGYCKIPERDQTELDTAELLDLLDRLKRAGTVRVGLWGGEPLVRADLPILVDRCRKHGFWTSVVTNGWLLPRRAAELMGVNHFLISLDGRPETHDAQRGAGSHARVMAALQSAHARGLPFWTITVLTERSLGDIDWVLDTAEKYNSQAMFQVLHHPPALAPEAVEAPDNTSLRAAIAHLLAEKAKGRPVGVSEHTLRYLQRWPDYRRSTSPVPVSGRSCLAGSLYCNVDADGRLYPCSLRVGAGDGPHFREGIDLDRLDHPDCAACTATAFTEYDALFGLDPRTIWSWVRALRPAGP